MQALADTLPADWVPVSPKLTAVREITNAATTLVALVVLGVPVALTAAGIWSGLPLWGTLVLPALVLLNGLTQAALIPRRVRAIRYSLRQDDLAMRAGVMFQRFKVIPYGRVQYVDLDAGPLQRAFGLCTVSVHTAAAAADPRIPGLSRADGDALRDAVAQRGEQRLAGL